MTEKIRVSILGLGSMGMAMTSRLLDQGLDVDVWNRSPRDISALLEKGARNVDLAQAMQNKFFISMLSNDSAAFEVFSSENLSKAKSGAVHLNMSTLSPSASQSLAELHASLSLGYVAAPVLGRPAAVLNGKLLVVAAGNAQQVEEASVVLDKLAAKHWYVGEDHSKANLVKLGVNYNIIHALQAIGESVALVEAGGVDPNTFIEIITHTAFNGAVYTGYGPMIVNRAYSPAGFSLELGLKDVKLVEDAAADMNLVLPVASVLRKVFDAALQETDLQGLDWSSIAEITRQRKQ